MMATLQGNCTNQKILILAGCVLLLPKTKHSQNIFLQNPLSLQPKGVCLYILSTTGLKGDYFDDTTVSSLLTLLLISHKM